jgi:hypothetical protein
MTSTGALPGLEYDYRLNTNGIDVHAETRYENRDTAKHPNTSLPGTKTGSDNKTTL